MRGNHSFKIIIIRHDSPAAKPANPGKRSAAPQSGQYYIAVQQKIRYAAPTKFEQIAFFPKLLWRLRMANDTLSKMSEQYQNFLNPVIKANKLSAANLEALVNFQMNALQSYIDLAMGRMKAAAEISDPSSLQSFLTSQAEAIAGVHQKFMDDTKALADLTSRFKAEFDKLVQESLPAGK